MNIRKSAVAAFMAAACIMPLAACGGADTGTPASAVVVDGQSYKLIDSVTELPQKPVTEGVHYFAFDAEPGTNNFGPAEALSSARDGAEKLAVRLTADPLHLATLIAFDKYGEGLDPAVVQANADSYAISKADRVKDVQAFFNNVVNVELIDMGTTRYDSLGMIPGSSATVRPTLTKFSEQPEMHQTLVLTMKSGKKIFLRVACGFQPSVPKFTKVTPPPVKEKPAKPVLCPEGTKFAGKPIPKDGACDIPPTKPETTPPSKSTTTQPSTTKTTSTTTTSTTTTSTTMTTSKPPTPTCPDGTPVPPNGRCEKETTRDPGPSIPSSDRPNSVPTGSFQPTQPPSNTGTTLPSASKPPVVIPSTNAPTQTGTATSREVPPLVTGAAPSSAATPNDCTAVPGMPNPCTGATTVAEAPK